MDYGRIAFQNIMENIEKQGFTSDNQKFLEVILPKELISKAMKLISVDAKIKYNIATESERCFWTFYNHKKGQTYYVFCDQDTSFCSCPAYNNFVIQLGKCPFCKHILAAFLCDVFRKREEAAQFIIEEMDDDYFAEFLAKTVFSSSFESQAKK